MCLGSALPGDDASRSLQRSGQSNARQGGNSPEQEGDIPLLFLLRFHSYCWTRFGTAEMVPLPLAKR